MKIILASKSGVRKKILDNYNIDAEVVFSNVDEDEIKNSLLAEGANPKLISKNLAEVKSVKVSKNNPIIAVMITKLHIILKLLIPFVFKIDSSSFSIKLI